MQETRYGVLEKLPVLVWLPALLLLLPRKWGAAQDLDDLLSYNTIKTVCASMICGNIELCQVKVRDRTLGLLNLVMKLGILL